MRIPAQPAERVRPRRRTLAILLGLALVVLLLVIGQALAGFYSNFLWFHSSGVGDVWGTITLTKVLLALVFVAVSFGLIFGCLSLVDVVVARTLFLGRDTELVRRYQAVVAPHALTLRSAVSLLVALALGVGASSQWQHWLLFEHAVPFGTKDPVFGRDLSFFVFRLPFLSFLVDWLFGALVVAFVLTCVAYFLNGAIRLQGSVHVEPRAIAHLCLLLSLMALERAWAYYFVDRFALDVSHNGDVAGAGYTDVHVRLPAMELLAVVSIAAFVILAFNVYQRTWTLPAIAVGLWVLLALSVGVIYPALLQAITVTPNQSTLELPYIGRNISATRNAMGLDAVATQSFPASQDLTPAVLARYNELLSDVQLWDASFTAPTFVQLQDEFNYYELSNLSVDRYRIDGRNQPVVIGVRALKSSGVPAQTWVNTHLEYTHGYGVVAAQSNGTASYTNGGNPPFVVSGVPEVSSATSLAIRQPDVYFSPGAEQYVVVDTKQSEIGPNGSPEHYRGSGGVPIGGLAERLAFAVHLHDFNLLISGDVTARSRLIYIPDVLTEVKKAFPFLAIDSNPYPVVDHGRIVWMLDGYTESSSFPYATAAKTSQLPTGSGLQGSYNYVRDAVKIAVDAYTGQMTLYAMAPNDPVLRSWEHVFPGLIQPKSAMDPTLAAHLRYPQDLLEVKAAMYATYHVSSPSLFYSQQSAWVISPTSSGVNGSPSNQLPIGPDGTTQRYTPIYEMVQLGGDAAPRFRAIEPLIRYSNGKLPNLTSLLIADCSSSSYGSLAALNTVNGSTTIDSPGLANADINADPAVSQELTFYDSSGSQVRLGTVQILPIADSLLYVRPLYISSSQTSYPLLKDVIVLYQTQNGKQVSIGATLADALAKLFGSSGGSPSRTGTSGASVPAIVRADIAEATGDYAAAQRALSSGDLGTYQRDVNAAASALQDANDLLAIGSSGSSATPSASKAHAPSAAAGPAA